MDSNRSKTEIFFIKKIYKNYELNKDERRERKKVSKEKTDLEHSNILLHPHTQTNKNIFKTIDL